MIYKNECGYYSVKFRCRGRLIHKRTRAKNAKDAKSIETRLRSELELGHWGILKPKPALTLAEFLRSQFLPYVEGTFKSRPATARYYRQGAESLLKCDFAVLSLAEITDQHSGQYATSKIRLSPSTINQGLRTLRRALNVAEQWGKLERAPHISLAKGERQRDRVLCEDEASRYLKACAQPWKDCATIMLGTGMRPSEIFSLRWERVYLKGTGGLLQITDGKSRAARRMLPLVPAVFSALKVRQNAQGNPTEGWVFPANTKSGHLEGGSAKNQHAIALKALNAETAKRGGPPKLKQFPPYCLRHTALTNLAAAGCDAFTLARIAGHSSITITQRYCHPQADAIELAFSKLANSKQVVTDGGHTALPAASEVEVVTTGK